MTIAFQSLDVNEMLMLIKQGLTLMNVLDEQFIEDVDVSVPHNLLPEIN